MSLSLAVVKLLSWLISFVNIQCLFKIQLRTEAQITYTINCSVHTVVNAGSEGKVMVYACICHSYVMSESNNKALDKPSYASDKSCTLTYNVYNFVYVKEILLVCS